MRDQILSHPDLRAILVTQSRAFLRVETESPKLASVFATQQRYLMSQTFLSLAFTSEDGSVLLTQFLDAVKAYGVASRNTADSFVKEMIQYGMGWHGEPRGDQRARPIFVAPEVVDAIRLWAMIHLATLDALDGGERRILMQQDGDLIRSLQPRVAAGILRSKLSMAPDGTFSLFTWMNDGGLVMEKMMAELADHPPEAERIRTSIQSFEELSEPLRVTRTHLARKMAIAEKMGSVGWEGKRGRSTLWLSKGFIAQFDAYQADKLTIIDRAFAEVTRGLRIDG